MLSMLCVATAALQIATVTTPPSRVVSAAPSRVAIVINASAAPEVTSSSEHIARARIALAAGDFDLARREYVTAVALDRDAGKLPVESSSGLAHVLYAQSYNREAAAVMDRLATEASSRGDANAEAKALLDAHWLNADAKQILQARANSSRLRALLKDPQLSHETRQLIASRFR